MNIYLKADSLEDLQAALVEAGILEFDFPGTRVNSRFLLDYIGIISRPTGETTVEVGPEDEECEVPVFEELPGVHANLIVRSPCEFDISEESSAWLSESERAALDPVTIEAPTEPFRVWAS